MQNGVFLFIQSIIITPPAVTASGVFFFEIVFITLMKKCFSFSFHGLMRMPPWFSHPDMVRHKDGVFDSPSPGYF